MRAGLVRPLAGAATVTGLAVGSPGAAAGVAAAATPDPAATPAASPAAPAGPDTTAAAAVTHSWIYIRSPETFRGSLLLVEDPLIPRQSWASGSGATTIRDECDRSTSAHDPGGPIPYGGYSVIDTSPNWPGSTVRGPVLRLSDGVCYDGHTTRTQLFVHSTYPWSDSHYASAGCVKVSSKGTPSNAGGDIRAVYDAYFKNGRPNHFVVAFGS